MRFCKNCEGVVGSCCDFCKHYDFRADANGCYTGDGWCTLHNRPEDPGSLCDDFYCFEVDKENEL